MLQKQRMLDQKQYQLLLLENKETQIRNEHSKVKDYLVKIDKVCRDKKYELDNKKALYEKASDNVELVTADKLKELFTEYKNADKQYNKITERQNYLNNKDREYNEKLEQLDVEKNKIKNDILDIKADIFDIQLHEPVWAIGEATCNLAEDETPDHCRNRALESAQRDAMEKAGKMILESETIVKNYKLYLDEIRTQIHAQIIEQDNSPQYGIRRVIKNSNITYVAKLRLKVQSISNYNPYRNQKSILSPKPEVGLTTEKVSKNRIDDDYKNVKRKRNFSISLPGCPTTFSRKGSGFLYFGLHHSDKPDNDGFISEGGGFEITGEELRNGFGWKWKIFNMDFYKNKEFEKWSPFMYSNFGIKAQLFYFSSFCNVGWGLLAWDKTVSDYEQTFEYYGLFHWNYGMDFMFYIDHKYGIKIGYDVLSFFADTENKKLAMENKVSQISFGLTYFLY